MLDWPMPFRYTVRWTVLDRYALRSSATVRRINSAPHGLGKNTALGWPISLISPSEEGWPLVTIMGHRGSTRLAAATTSSPPAPGILQSVMIRLKAFRARSV